jgi:hypothetical protein
VYYDQWCKYINTDLSPNDFSGIQLHEIPKAEECFQININIFERQQDGAVVPIYKSSYKFKSNIYLNLHGHHLSYVNNFKAYAKKYQCPKCQRHFDHLSHIKRHLQVCSQVTKLRFPGGDFKTNDTVFDKLEELGIVLPDEEKIDPWFIKFDFEAVLQQINDHPTSKLRWIEKHQPIPMSVYSNVDSLSLYFTGMLTEMTLSTVRWILTVHISLLVVSH